MPVARFQHVFSWKDFPRISRGQLFGNPRELQGNPLGFEVQGFPELGGFKRKPSGNHPLRSPTLEKHPYGTPRSGGCPKKEIPPKQGFLTAVCLFFCERICPPPPRFGGPCAGALRGFPEPGLLDDGLLGQKLQRVGPAGGATLHLHPRPSAGLGGGVTPLMWFKAKIDLK